MVFKEAHIARVTTRECQYFYGSRDEPRQKFGSLCLEHPIIIGPYEGYYAYGHGYIT